MRYFVVYGVALALSGCAGAIPGAPRVFVGDDASVAGLEQKLIKARQDLDAQLLYISASNKDKQNSYGCGDPHSAAARKAELHVTDEQKKVAAAVKLIGQYADALDAISKGVKEWQGYLTTLNGIATGLGQYDPEAKAAATALAAASPGLADLIASAGAFEAQRTLATRFQPRFDAAVTLLSSKDGLTALTESEQAAFKSWELCRVEMAFYIRDVNLKMVQTDKYVWKAYAAQPTEKELKDEWAQYQEEKATFLSGGNLRKKLSDDLAAITTQNKQLMAGPTFNLNDFVSTAKKVAAGAQGIETAI